jgi:hypothetical protein
VPILPTVASHPNQREQRNLRCLIPCAEWQGTSPRVGSGP